MKSNPMLTEIAAQFLDARGWKSTTPLAAQRVRGWMKSDDIEVLGAANRLLFVTEHLNRVAPPLSFKDSPYAVGLWSRGLE